MDAERLGGAGLAAGTATESLDVASALGVELPEGQVPDHGTGS